MRILSVLTAAAVVHGTDPSMYTTGGSMDGYDASGMTDDTSITTTTTTTTTKAPITPPPLGPVSSQLQGRYTSDGVRARLSDRGEDASYDRFRLQSQLTASSGEKNVSMAIMQAISEDSKKQMIEYSKKVDNLTSILTADASAGGVQATSRALMSSVPQAQKMLSKMTKQELKNVGTDSSLIKKIIDETAEEYREKMETYGLTISQLIAQQDAAYARLASGQMNAMSQSAAALRSSAIAGLSDTRSAIQASIQQIAKSADKGSAGADKATSKLNDAEDILTAFPSEFRSSLTGVSSDIQSVIDKNFDSSVNQISKTSDTLSSSVEAVAEAAGKETEKQMSQLDKSGQRMIGSVLTDVSKNATSLSKTVDKVQQQNLNQISAVGSQTNSSISSITHQANIVAGDNAKVVGDLKNMLSQQQALSGTISSAFGSDIGKLNGGLVGRFDNINFLAKGVASDVNSDASDELVRQNKGIAALIEQAIREAGLVSATSRSKLSASQAAQAQALSSRQNEIGRQSDLMQAAMESLSQSGIKFASGANDKINGIAGTFTGSISDLLAMIQDSNGSSGLNQIASQYIGKSTDAFASVLDSLKSASADGTDSSEDLVKKLLGPSTDAANGQLNGMQTLLATLLGASEDQSKTQSNTMADLSKLRQILGSKVNGVSQSMRGIFGLNSELANSVANQGGTVLSDNRRKIIEVLQAQLAAAKSQSADGLVTIDKLINAVNGQNKLDTDQRVSKSIGAVSANVDAANSDLVDVQRAQIRSLAGLSSMAVSLLGQSSDQSVKDGNSVQSILTSTKASIISKFREIAANSTDTALGETLFTLARTGNDTEIINFLVNDVREGLNRVNADAAVARDVSDKKKSQFEAYLAAAERDARDSQAAIVNMLEKTISDVQTALRNKTLDLNKTDAEMKASLNDIRAQVEQAQANLRSSVDVFRDKFSTIVGQIRSYMNVSAEADELAIRNDIARQLSQVNATEISVATANAAVANKLETQKDHIRKSSDAQNQLVGQIIDGAITTESGMSDSRIANREKLIGVAATVDRASGELETSLSDSANEISSGIDTSSSGASQLLKSREGDQAKAIDQINTKANDVNLQARKAFVNNLEKMGGVDDDTLMVSKQLGTMIDGTQKGITDISASTMSHLDLSTRTMAKLNSQSAKNLATVADVMKTFTTVVVGFLNETSLTMESLTSDLSSVQNTSSVRLKQMEVRSADEHNWVESHLNEVSDRLKNLDAENDSNQNSFKSGLSTTESTLQHWRLEREKEIADFKDQLDQVRQNLIQTNNEQVNRVRDWIQKRNPKIAQQLLSAATSGAFIQTSPLLVEAQSRQSVVRELTGRIAHVKDDIRRLRKRRT